MTSRAYLALAVATAATISTLSWGLAATPARLRDEVALDATEAAMPRLDRDRGQRAASVDVAQEDEAPRLILPGQLPPLPPSAQNPQRGEVGVEVTQTMELREYPQQPLFAEEGLEQVQERPATQHSIAYQHGLSIINRIETRVDVAINELQRLQAAGRHDAAAEVWSQLGRDIREISEENNTLDKELSVAEREELGSYAQRRLMPKLRRLQAQQAMVVRDDSPPDDEIDEEPGRNGIDGRDGVDIDQDPSLQVDRGQSGEDEVEEQDEGEE